MFLRIIILLYDKTRSSIGAPLWVTILKPPKQQLFLLILSFYAAKPYGTVQNRSGPLKTVMCTLFPIQDRSPKSKPFGLRSKYVQITFKLRSITFKLRKNYVKNRVPKQHFLCSYFWWFHANKKGFMNHICKRHQIR